MSKWSNVGAVEVPKPASGGTSRDGHPHHHPNQGTGRETCESIAFAFVLALLFRSFVAEAFVIPTGSMAPTLFGRNKDVVCPECGHKYAIGASDELDDRSGTFLIVSQRVDQSMCPNCRHMHDVKPLPVFKGDRILVNKSAYEFGEPDRWDVIVFRYPDESEKNYIKRLVGLPGETLRVERGDVYARQGATGAFHILRKQDPNKQKLLQQVVYDDRHPPRDLLSQGWPEAWQPLERSDAATSVAGWTTAKSGWQQDSKHRRFELKTSDELRWLRYQHLVPKAADWSAVADGKQPDTSPNPELVSDYCGYNTYTGGRGGGLDDDRFWVGDLTLNCTVNIAAVAGQDAHVLLELVEGVRRYRCRIDVPSGLATLTRNDDLAANSETAPQVELATAQTPIKGPGTYTLRFANVDDRLCLWVNDSWVRNGLISFGEKAEFDAPANRRPQDADLLPVGVAARGMDVSVSDLVVQRDIYYRAESVGNDGRAFPTHEVDENLPLREALSDPEAWGELYEQNARTAEFSELASDEFFVMGDNSPRSQDSRLWPNTKRDDLPRRTNRHAVPRHALIGKAFFVYWPHGIPFMNGGRGFNVRGHSPVPQVIDQQTPPWVRERIVEERKEAANYPEYVIPFYPQWWRWQRIR